ncbi:hypothetical protein [Variovorax sp. W6]|uniref:hypothetical protein n=1 Tax=Variovorax sp. W6 TaxID=3093895 RepID=UPI003D801B38
MIAPHAPGLLLRSLVTCRGLAGLFLLAGFSSSWAGEPAEPDPDRLSGEYRVVDKARGTASLALFSIHKTDKGWELKAGKDSRELDPLSTEDVRALLKGEDPASVGMQCGASTRVLVCHVAPGTSLGDGFTASTGHFMTILHTGVFELVRTGPEPGRKHANSASRTVESHADSSPSLKPTLAHASRLSKSGSGFAFIYFWVEQ